MAGDRARGTLKRAAEQSARTMLAAVRQAIAEARRLIAEALSGDGKALTEVGRGARGGIYARLDVLFRNRLKESLDGALRSLAEAMAEAGNAAANARAEAAGDGVSVRFSPEYLRDYLERVTPKNAHSIAAVYTESMGAHAKEALRLAAVETFRDGAAAGLTLREQMKLLQENWALAARDDAPFRFVDRAGRRWENARYVQMLARTTAQRVRTAAYCDTLLRMNRPLVRVTNYANGRDCGVCAAWEGRLLDISSGRELRRFGIPSLDEARAAGLFHPNCVHNVLYVPIDEYPPAILKALGGRLSSGEPSFGNPVKTNALNETAASARRRAEEAAQAAKRKAEEEAAAKDALELLKSLVPHAVDALTGEAAARTAQAQAAAQDAAGALAANAVKTITDALDKEWEDFTAALDKPETLGKRLGGSTGARLVELLGRKFVLKGGASPEHLASEQAADEAYRAAGLNVPEQRTVTSKSGKRFKLADFTEGQDLAAWWRAKGRTEAEREALRAKLRAGLDVDAMLGNWDVIGMGGDNILVDKDGEPWRIDNGGALGFRAQGARKADADWKDGWPNELFTIAGSPNNAPYVGGVTPTTLIRQAAKRDWQKVLDALPDQADKDALAKRVAEMRQLAARTDDFDRGGYDDAFTARVVEHSFNLSKEGFREEVPQTVTYGNYGFCRSKPTTAGLVGGQPGEQFGSLALAAAKTVGTHAKDHAYNTKTLDAFYAKEPELQAILKADPKNKGAKHYLDVMAQIKSAVANHTTLPHIDTSIRVRQTSAPAKTKYTSLTDHIAQYMAAHGADYGFISKWCDSQSRDSWKGKPSENGPKATCRRKVVQLAARGLNWDPPPPAPGVWYGTGDKQRESAYKGAADFYKQDPAQLDKDVETVAQYKAAVQLLLENADFNGNDKSARATKLFRTESASVVSGMTIGSGKDFAVGPAESFSVFKAVSVNGSHGTIVNVPWSRINAAYFMERTPGRNDKLFLGEDENEFNVDAIGLRKVFVGQVNYHDLVNQFHHLL